MGRRARIATYAAAAALPVWVWAPALVASRYTDAGAAEMLARPDRGWHFLADAVVESRGAKLGWDDAALAEARRRWVSRPAAERVSLRWGGDEIDVGGRIVRARSPLNWVVTGRPAPGADRRIIAVLDYHSGRVVWSLRTKRRASR